MLTKEPFQRITMKNTTQKLVSYNCITLITMIFSGRSGALHRAANQQRCCIMRSIHSAVRESAADGQAWTLGRRI